MRSAQAWDFFVLIQGVGWVRGSVAGDGGCELKPTHVFCRCRSVTAQSLETAAVS
jgi:hypothetical protein